jgi:hypothetical protein
MQHLKLARFDVKTDIFDLMISFIDTLDYVNMLLVSKQIYWNTVKHRKTRLPYVVVATFLTDGLWSLSEQCYNEMKSYGIKIEREMSRADTRKFIGVVLKLGTKAHQFGSPMQLYAVPWRYRDCIKTYVRDERDFVTYSTNKYMRLCIEKCHAIINETPHHQKKEMESQLFQKIMSKYNKTKRSYGLYMDEFNDKLDQLTGRGISAHWTI